MDVAHHLAIGVSAILFSYYGFVCVVGERMAVEFERFGLPQFRVLTGALELLGAAGLVAGYVVPVLTVAASGGLAALMVLGVLVRLRVRDPLVAMLPAIGLLFLNAWIFIHALTRAPH